MISRMTYHDWLTGTIFPQTPDGAIQAWESCKKLDPCSEDENPTPETIERCTFPQALSKMVQERQAYFGF